MTWFEACQKQLGPAWARKVKQYIADLNTQDCKSPVLLEIRNGMKMAKEDKSTWFEDAQAKSIYELTEMMGEDFSVYFGPMVAQENKEDNTMKVSYKGITGELIRMERGSELVNLDLTSTFCNPKHNGYSYNLDIWDSEKKCKVSFTGVPVKDVKFLGGEVTYG